MAEKFAAEGCNVAINYNANQERANQVARKVEKEYKVRSLVVKGVSGTLLPFLTVLDRRLWTGCRCIAGLRADRRSGEGWPWGVGYHYLERCKLHWLDLGVPCTF